MLKKVVIAVVVGLLSSLCAVGEELPSKVHGCKLRKADTAVVYSLKKYDVDQRLKKVKAAYVEAVEVAPDKGFVFVIGREKEAAVLLAALGDDPFELPDGMDLGDDMEMSTKELLCMVPISLDRRCMASLLEVEEATLSDYQWFVAVPTAKAQKKVFKKIIKRQMKEEEINLAMRMIIAPFMGKLSSMALDAMEPGCDAIFFQAWLAESGLPEERQTELLEAYSKAAEAEAEKNMEKASKELEKEANKIAAKMEKVDPNAVVGADGGLMLNN